MTKLKVYIAGSWKNKEKIEYIMREIENWGYNIAVDWTKHQEKGNAKQYAEEDLNGLKECDSLIYCMDSNHSRGKNFELGYIAALNKPIAIYIIPNDGIVGKGDIPIDSLIDKECIFIRARSYPIISSINSLRLLLENLEIKLLLSKMRQNKWNDKKRPIRAIV